MDYRLICGDANKVLPRLAQEGVEVDMVFCSPNPLFYNLERKHNVDKYNPNSIGSEHSLYDYIQHLRSILSKVYLILRDTGSLWVHMMDAYMMNGSMIQVPERFALEMVKSVGQEQWFLRGKRAWIRGPHEITAGSTAAANLCPWDWEPIYWFVKYPEGYMFNTASPYAKTSVIMHSPYVEKVPNLPEEVMIEAISLTTKPGDTVLDCFMATGQTGIAALSEGRKFIGIELSADKVALAQKRLRRYAP